jgi:hypothetical protein
MSRDSLSELSELVSKGDEKGIFRNGLPPAIEQIVRSENLEFSKNRSIYDKEYFEFINNMLKVVIINEKIENCSSSELDCYSSLFSKQIKLCDDDSEQFYTEAASLGLEFLFNTYFKTGRKLRYRICSHLYKNSMSSILYIFLKNQSSKMVRIVQRVFRTFKRSCFSYALICQQPRKQLKLHSPLSTRVSHGRDTKIVF